MSSSTPFARLLRIAEVADLVRRVRPLLDVVAEHQLVRAAHRGFGLVLVVAAGEREQLADPVEHPIDRRASVAVAARPARRPRARRCRARSHTRWNVGPCAVSSRHAEHLVDVLVRHLVLEHARDLEPRPLEDQRARQLEPAGRARPTDRGDASCRRARARLA